MQTKQIVVIFPAAYITICLDAHMTFLHHFFVFTKSNMQYCSALNILLLRTLNFRL